MEDLHSIKSFNWDAGVYTAIFFLFGLFYYIYKFHNFQNIINNGVFRRNTSENSQNNNNNNNNQDNQNNQNNSNDNNANTGSSDPIQENYLKINFLIGGNKDKETHIIHKELPLRNFIQMHLTRYYNTDFQSVYLIYQGIRLDISKSLGNYPRIKNDAIIHCFITSLHSNSENRRNRGSDNNSNFTSNLEYDDNVVQLQSIILHSCFFLVGILLLFVNKKHPEIFSESSKYVFAFIYAIWLNQLTKVIAKFIIFRRINWNI